MSTIDTRPEPITAVAPVDPRARPAGVAAIGTAVTSSDHKVIGRMFIGGSLLALLGGLALGVLLAIERTDGGSTLVDAGVLPQLFTAHRFALIYAVLLPLLLGIAIAIVPLQVGARALAFPRLAAAGFWTWLGGVVLVVVALAGNGGPLGGDADMVDLFLLGQALVAIGLTAAAGSIAATVLTTRAPGMRMRRVPFFTWSALVTSLGLLLVLPVVVGAVVYLFVDHRNARALFGGNAGISTWLGFAWTQPATYLFALPAVGIAVELLPVTFRKRMPMRGVVFTGITLVGVAALAAVTQQSTQDLPWSGSGFDLGGFGQKLQDLVPYALFLLVPVLGVLVVMAAGALVAKPTKGGPRPKVTAPFAFSFLGLGMIFVGMLGGALTPIVDLGLQGTVFEEGALVYVTYGAVLAALGALTYWMPKLTGRLLPDKPALGLAGLGFVATVLASLPYYVAGFADQPAASSEYDYSGPAELWNIAVAAGHALMLAVVVAFLGLTARTLAGPSDTVDDDPWEAHTLEWSTSSPAPAGNFLDPPTVMSPEPVFDLRATPQDRSDR